MAQCLNLGVVIWKVVNLIPALPSYHFWALGQDPLSVSAASCLNYKFLWAWEDRLLEDGRKCKSAYLSFSIWKCNYDTFINVLEKLYT